MNLGRYHINIAVEVEAEMGAGRMRSEAYEKVKAGMVQLEVEGEEVGEVLQCEVVYGWLDR